MIRLTMQGKRSLRMEGLYGKRNMLTDEDRVKENLSDYLRNLSKMSSLSEMSNMTKCKS